MSRPSWDIFLIDGRTGEPVEAKIYEGLEPYNIDHHENLWIPLIFMASRFSAEAADYSPSMQAIKTLGTIYGNTQASTLRRFVLHAHNKPMIAVIMKPHWVTENQSDDVLDLCRYFVPSKQFLEKFSRTSPVEIVQHVKDSTYMKSGGPVGGGTLIVSDDNGEPHEFVSDAFFNRYDILCLISYVRKYPVLG